MGNKKNCCETDERKISGFWQGLVFGLLPHSFCIAFIIFSVLGVTVFASLVRQVFLVPYFFQFLVLLSIVLATVAAVFYLRQNGLFSILGLKRKWRYLSLLYGTTLVINLLFFFVIFPRVANLGEAIRPSVLGEKENLASISLSVDIPCSGHAPLIIEGLKKLPGVKKVVFNSKGFFEVSFDPKEVSPQKFLSLEIFKIYQPKIINQ